MNTIVFEELRSDDAQEILDSRPPWAVRWGNSVFLVILLGLLVLSFFIRYPEVITCSFRLLSDNAPKAVLTKTAGRLSKIWVKDNQLVSKGQMLAFIESTASHQEILVLSHSLDSLLVLVNANRFDKISSFKAQDFQQLGELQGDYQSFMKQFIETSTLFSQGYLSKKQGYIKTELADLEQNHDQLLSQYDIQKQDYELAQKEFAMHKKLYDQKVTAWVEYNREERNILAKQLPLRQLDMTVTNNMTAQTLKNKELTELLKQANDLKMAFGQSLNTLRAAVANWKLRFVPVAPVAGRVFFASLWQEQQMIKNDETLFYVSNSDTTTQNSDTITQSDGVARQQASGLFGEVKIRQANAGKIKIGQRVLVKFPSYPFEQFGMVEGRIKDIASIPLSDSTFRAVVSLPNGLITNAHKTLPFKNGLNASAEVVTENLSVAQRLFYQLRKLW